VIQLMSHKIKEVEDFTEVIIINLKHIYIYGVLGILWLQMLSKEDEEREEDINVAYNCHHLAIPFQFQFTHSFTSLTVQHNERRLYAFSLLSGHVHFIDLSLKSRLALIFFYLTHSLLVISNSNVSSFCFNLWSYNFGFKHLLTNYCLRERERERERVREAEEENRRRRGRIKKRQITCTGRDNECKK